MSDPFSEGCEEPWEVRRAREWCDRFASYKHPELDKEAYEHRVQNLAALLRDCWGAGYLDGQ